jgi:hypothetical protein
VQHKIRIEKIEALSNWTTLFLRTLISREANQKDKLGYCLNLCMGRNYTRSLQRFDRKYYKKFLHLPFDDYYDDPLLFILPTNKLFEIYYSIYCNYSYILVLLIRITICLISFANELFRAQRTYGIKDSVMENR